MSQTKEPKHIPEEEEFEHGSNAFGFFHRHQKAIIYSAGIFTLLTFSITAAITDFFDRLTGPGYEHPTLTVPGIGEVQLTEEDHAIAQGIRRVRSSIFTLGYLSPLGVDDAQHNYTEQLAAIRALAVKAGIDASDDDVEAINNSAINSFPSVQNVKHLAYRTGTADVALYNRWMRETLRVSTFLRLTALGVGQSQDEVIESVLDKNESLRFSVAYLDTKAFKEEVKKGLTDEVLKKFLADMEESKSDRFRKLAQRVSIKVAMLDAETFKHEPYLGVEIDKQKQIGDAEIQERYQLHREDRYKLPKKATPEPEKKDEEPKKADPGKKDDPNKDNGSVDPLAQDGKKQGDESKSGDAGKQGDGAKPGDAAQQGEGPLDADQNPDTPAQDGYMPLDEKLRAKITEELFAETVLAKWQASLDRAMAAHMLEAINKATAADIALEKAREAKTKAEADLAEKEGEEELKAAAEKAKAAFEAAEKVAEAAKKAVDDRRAAFDFEAEVKKLAKGRPGLKIIDVSEMKDAEGLRKVEELGEWRDSHLPSNMTLAGEIYNGRVQNTKKGAFIFQVAEIEERGFRDFKDIKDDLETLYVDEQAEKNTKAKKESFEASLEKLARENLKADVEKIEAEGAKEAAEKFAKWKSKVEGEIAEIEADLAKIGDDSLVAYKRKKTTLEEAKKELENAEDTKKSLADKVEKETEKKIDEKLEEAYADVLAAAGKEAGMTVETVGPFSRKLSTQPRFKFRFPNVVQAIYGQSLDKTDEGDVMELTDDPINDVTYMAVCTKVSKPDPKQISRRQWLAERKGDYGGSFAGQQMLKAINKSWTIEALEKGYGWNRPIGPGEKALGAAKDRAKKAAEDDKKDGEKKGEK